MEYSKAQRQRAVADIVRTHNVSSQEEIAEQLATRGFAVTQATVSRDLEQIGALKVRRSGRVSYSLPDQLPDASSPRVEWVFGQWVRSVALAMNTIVLRTPPGSAHIVGVALDNSKIDGVVGTICGDDTLFVACRSIEDAQSLAGKFRSDAGLDQE